MNSVLLFQASFIESISEIVLKSLLGVELIALINESLTGIMGRSLALFWNISCNRWLINNSNFSGFESSVESSKDVNNITTFDFNNAILKNGISCFNLSALFFLILSKVEEFKTKVPTALLVLTSKPSLEGKVIVKIFNCILEFLGSSLGFFLANKRSCSLLNVRADWDDRFIIKEVNAHQNSKFFSSFAFTFRLEGLKRFK